MTKLEKGRLYVSHENTAFLYKVVRLGNKRVTLEAHKLSGEPEYGLKFTLPTRYAANLLYPA